MLASPAGSAAGRPVQGPASILFVSVMNGGAWGGSEELWYRTALHAARQGRRVGCAVFGWPEKAERLEALRRAGCQVFELPNEGRQRRSMKEKLAYEVLTRARQRLAVERLPVEAYELVVLNQGGFGEVSSGVWSRLRSRARRYALTFHNYREPLRLPARRSARLERWVGEASANLFASDRIREELERLLGARVPRAGLLINPVTFPVPDAPTPLPPAPPFRLAMLAALDLERKAQDELVAALAAPEWRERPWVLELHGEGPGAPRLRELIAANGLSDRVRLPGHTTDPRAALAGAHVLLQITRVDAMPLSVLEAMAMGRPVVVSRVGDMPDWVQDGSNGWICEGVSVERIRACLERAWAARARWAEMGARAFQTLRQRYPASVEEAFLAQLGEPAG